MKKRNLTMLSFMTIIFLSSCSFSSTQEKENIIKVEESGKAIYKGIETNSISTGFTNK